MSDQFDDIGSWAAGTIPSEGELVLSPSEIEAIVDSVMSTMGFLVYDAADIPGTATVRPRGGFTLPDDMRLYLEGGGLLTRDSEGQFVPSPLVTILKRPQEDGSFTIYEVWIDEQTN